MGFCEMRRCRKKYLDWSKVVKKPFFSFCWSTGGMGCNFACMSITASPHSSRTSVSF
nr:MAG TPA: hypothetical protein [Caudoviricetes sp.]